METQAPAASPLNSAGARPHPMIVTAAAAVTLFSATGVAALAGWLPRSTGTTTASEAMVAQSPAVAAAPAAVRIVSAAPAVSAPAPAPRTRAVTTRTETRTEPLEEPATPRSEPDRRPVALSQAQAVEPAPAAEPVKRSCHECGTIESVQEVERPGEANGVGIGAGAVLGGLLGRQMGGGRGRDAMTVLGAIGGAVAGNQIEKHTRRTLEYQVTVRFEDGSSQTLTQATPPGWRPGDRVRVVNGSIQANG